MKSRPDIRLSSWALTALLTSLLGAAPAPSVGTYVDASELGPKGPDSSYLPPPPRFEQERFSVAELRRSARTAGAGGYVDLGRFRALRREVEAP